MVLQASSLLSHSMQQPFVLGLLKILQHVAQYPKSAWPEAVEAKTMKAHLYLSPLRNVPCNSVSSLHLFCVFLALKQEMVTQKAHSFGGDSCMFLVTRQHRWI